MSGRDDHRVRSRQIWRQVMQAEPPPVTDPYTEVTTDHLMGRVWARSGLARRDRRLVTLTIAAVTAQNAPLRNHLRASLASGDLSIEELHEWVIHVAHYGGWPAATTAYAALVEISAVSKDAPTDKTLPERAPIERVGRGGTDPVSEAGGGRRVAHGRRWTARTPAREGKHER